MVLIDSGIDSGIGSQPQGFRELSPAEVNVFTILPTSTGTQGLNHGLPYTTIIIIQRSFLKYGISVLQYNTGKLVESSYPGSFFVSNGPFFVPIAARKADIRN